MFSKIRAIINRYGFNSEGIVAVAKRLGAQHGKRRLAETARVTSSGTVEENRHGGKAGPGILGVNLGKNKTSDDASADYVQGVHTLSQYADYLVSVRAVMCLCPSNLFGVLFLTALSQTGEKA